MRWSSSCCADVSEALLWSWADAALLVPGWADRCVTAPRSRHKQGCVRPRAHLLRPDAVQVLVGADQQPAVIDRGRGVGPRLVFKLVLGEQLVLRLGRQDVRRAVL